jgi:hypothetical protein
MKKIFGPLCAAAVWLISLAPSVAHADGLALKAADLPAAARTSLASEVAAEKVKHPEAFEAVAAVQGHRPEVYKKFRNPTPSVDRELRALGPSALLPMLSALALEAPPMDGLGVREREALTVGMLNAVGVLRDARSGPVLRAALEKSEAGSRMERAAAEAMGRLCGDAEIAALSAHTAAGDTRRLAAIEGLGQCRRQASAKQLVGVLKAVSPGDPAAVAAAQAMGTLGSSWAWEAMGPKAAAEGEVVRKMAAQALVEAFAKLPGEARTAAQKSLSLVEHPAAITAIDSARASADPETIVALDALRVKLARVSAP